MHGESVAAGTGAVRQEKRWLRAGLPALLLLAGVTTAAAALVRPRLAASAGAAALVMAGAASALRGRRRAPPAPMPSLADSFLRNAGRTLTTSAPLEGLLGSLAAAVGGAAALERQTEAGHQRMTSHPESATRERLRRLASNGASIVPAIMRTAEPCLLAGSAARQAGGLPAWLGGGSAVAVPVRESSGAVVGWLLAARSADDPELGEDDVALTKVVAALAGVVLEGERHGVEAQAGLQAQSDFLAVMSHELKTPLNVIIGYADLVLMGLPEPVPAGARRHVERLRGSARELQDRIEEILTYVRVAGGSAAPEEDRGQVDVVPLLREVAARAEPLARAKGLAFLVRTPATPLVLPTYPEALARVLELILSNAVKFTYEGGIEAELSARPARIRIRDSGIGIAPEHLAHIFEPFWQVNSRATRRERGLGLGLTTARALARALGGDIAVESVPGAGTTVTVSLGDRAFNDAPAA